MLACGCVCALLIRAGWLAFGEKAEYVLVEKGATSYRGDDEFVMTEEILADQTPHIRVGSISEDCQGYRFAGNAIVMERVRCVASAVVWGFLDGLLVSFAVFLWKKGTFRDVKWRKARRKGAG